MHEDLIDNYDDLYNHLLLFETELRGRGQVKNGQHHWLELDNNPTIDALKNYEKPTIIWKEISAFSSFTVDYENYYLPNTSYFLICKDLQFTAGILNSKLSDFQFNEISPQIAGGSKRYTKQYVEKLRIPLARNEQKCVIEKIVNQILTSKKTAPQADTTALEAEIDQLVYELYGLTDEEIAIVEESVG